MKNVLNRTALFLRTLLVICLGTSLFATSHAVIPAAERTALQALYTSTNGASWTNNTNWNGAAGTECTWFGVTCSAGDANVIFISVNSNNLTGTLPALSAFTALQNFTVSNNSIGGSIPSLAGLTTLLNFVAGGNDLTGTIPSLAGLTSLINFRVGSNQLTGSIPSLTGLTALQDFDVQVNQLTGAIPSLTGLTALSQFQAYNNQLTGSIPSLAGLTSLGTFFAFNNQLTGNIPALTGLTNLNEFDVSGNQLTGAIPSLAGLSELDLFRVHNNQLSGAIPPVPAPVNSLNPGESALCPNQLTPSVDPAWDAATGSTPWSSLCGGSGVSFTVTPSAGANGAISPATPQTVAQGGSITFMTIPNAGFVTSTVGISGSCNLGNTAPNENLVSNVQGNCTFSATFALAPANFTVTPSVISGSGTVSPSTPQSIASGATIAFTFTPNPGFILGGLQGSCSGNLIGNVFTTDAIAADCTVGVVFAPDRNAQATAVPTLGQGSLLLLSALAALLGIAHVRVSHRASLFNHHRK
jgi:IPTL-CTERM motif/Divergent InlB B-repeat domain